MNARALTWASLLAHWAEFAAASRGLPATSDGSRWKKAVPEIIGLQAVTFALGEAHQLDEGEFALAQDRAELLIRAHAGALRGLWRAEEPPHHLEPLPTQLDELIQDAQGALASTRRGGLEFRVAGERLMADHPAELVASLLAPSKSDDEPGFDGDLFLPAPGVPLMRTSPAAFIRGRKGLPVGDEIARSVRAFLGTKREIDGPHHVPGLRQVYRQFDFGRPGRNQGPVRDAIAAREDMILPGQPLLVPAILAGEPQPVPMPIRGQDQVDALPVHLEHGR